MILLNDIPIMEGAELIEDWPASSKHAAPVCRRLVTRPSVRKSRESVIILRR